MSLRYSASVTPRLAATILASAITSTSILTATSFRLVATSRSSIATTGNPSSYQAVSLRDHAVTSYVYSRGMTARLQVDKILCQDLTISYRVTIVTQDADE